MTEPEVIKISINVLQNLGITEQVDVEKFKTDLKKIKKENINDLEHLNATYLAVAFKIVLNESTKDEENWVKAIKENIKNSYLSLREDKKEDPVMRTKAIIDMIRYLKMFKSLEDF